MQSASLTLLPAHWDFLVGFCSPTSILYLNSSQRGVAPLPMGAVLESLSGERVDEYIYQEGVMEVENGERSMKTAILWKTALVVSALLVFLFAILGEAAPVGEAGPQVAIQPAKATKPPSKVTIRPLSDFLDAQGTGDMFFPPVRDYVGWSDSQEEPTVIALVDYAGLASDYLRKRHVKLDTRVNGFVIQTELASGRAQIVVSLFTANALGFAQSVADLTDNGQHDPDYLNTPTIFGNKAQDVARGKEAAVGQSSFWVTFSIPKPGAPLPDLVDVLVNNPDAFRPSDANFVAIIPGKCEHGKKAILHVDQSGPPGEPGREIVEIVREPCH